MLQLLGKICQILDALQIPYMLSGSVAMNLYADPRMTQDIDIIIEMEDYDVPAFLGMLDNQFYVYPEGIYVEIRRKGMFNIIHFKTGYKVDFILKSHDMFEQFKFQNRYRTNLFGIECWVISLNDLIISKLRWIQELESEKQKNDIANLLHNENVDLEYLNRWCKLLKLKKYNLF